MWSADLCYFFLPQEGIYVNAGVGPVLDAPEFGDPLTGFGAYAGVGWEFTQYLSVGADVSVASVSNDYSDVSGTGRHPAVFLWTPPSMPRGPRLPC